MATSFFLFSSKKLLRSTFVSSSMREDAGGKPARTEADVPLLQKSDRRKLFLQLCEHTATGRGLVAGDRRRSRHAQIKIMIL